jgi:hypothetical protein
VPRAKTKAARKSTVHRRRRPTSKPSAALVVQPQPERPWVLSQEEITIVKNSIAKGASDEELKFCLTVARRYRLDPFKQQIWFVKRWDSNADNGAGGKGAQVWTPQVAVSGLLFAAARDHKAEFGSVALPEYGPMFKPDGKSLSAPEWAKVKVWKKGMPEPTEAQAWWTEYVPADLTKAPFWRKMPRRMIGKCATALALRQAYPDLGGLYIPEECERMNEDYTPAGRRIVELKPDAAQEVAKQKLEAHKDGKAIGGSPVPATEAEDPLRTIQIIEWKDGLYVLTGNGLPIVRAEMTNEEKTLFTFHYDADARGFTIPGGQTFAFQDVCRKKGVETTFAEKVDTAKW